MFGKLKNWMGLQGGEVQKPRKLSHPRDLKTGDIIKFRHLDQSDVSAKEFEVVLVNTYLYGNMCYPELVLKDRANSTIYMMVEEEDGEVYLALSKKVGKTKIGDIIDQAQLDTVLQRGTGSKVTIQTKPEGFDEWLANQYTETDDSVKGAFIKGDARFLPDENMNQQDKFSSHTLVDPSDGYALEIEVYGTGETELSVTVYHEIEEIEEMWPGSAGAA